MKSIKQGRGPSLIGGIVALGMSVFGLVMAGEVRATESHFSAFGSNPGAGGGVTFCYLFSGACILVGIYSIYCAVAKNRPSHLDITDGDEEPDPLNEHFHGSRRTLPSAATAGRN